MHVLYLLCGSHVCCNEQVHTLKRVIDSLNYQTDPCFEVYLSVSYDEHLVRPDVLRELHSLLAHVEATDPRFHVVMRGARRWSQFEHFFDVVAHLWTQQKESIDSSCQSRVWCGFFDDDDVLHPNRTLIMNKELISSGRGLYQEVKEHVLFFSDSVVCTHAPSLTTTNSLLFDTTVLPWRNQEYVSMLVDLGCLNVMLRSTRKTECIQRLGFDVHFNKQLRPLAREVTREHVLERYQTPWMYLYVFDDTRSASQMTTWIRHACPNEMAYLTGASSTPYTDNMTE